MSKTNLFTLFVTVIVVVVVAELLVNDYVSYPNLQEKITAGVKSGDIQTSITGDEDAEEPAGVINFDLHESLQPQSTTDLAESIEFSEESSEVVEVVESDTEEKATITFSLIEQVGFENVVLQRVPFNGIMFERLDMRDFKSVPIIQQKLLQNNRTTIAEFYELHAESTLLANEIYLLIKEKASQAIEANVNETNEYGEGSYYINYVDRGDTAFLVVKVRESVYAFVYKKELHTFIKSLILIL